MIKKNILLTLFVGFLFGENDFSIEEQNNIAKKYIETSLYEEALSVYKNVLNTKTNIFGELHIELISTLYNLSDLVLLMNDIESSEEYLKKVLNIQYNNFLKKQTNYIPTYNKIKNIYSVLNDSLKIKKLDSLLNILNVINEDSIVQNIDSLRTYPFIIHFQKTKLDSTDLVSQYSNNDKAIDFINNGLMYLEAKIYTEAIKNFNQGLKVEACIIDKNYLINIDFGNDTLIINEFQNTLMEISLYDSTITCDQLLLGLLNINLNGDFKKTSQYINNYIEKYNDFLKIDGTAVEGRSAAEALSDISSEDNSWAGSQRATAVTDNDGSYDMDAGQNFITTPSGSTTITFTNITNGQSGFIKLINSGGETISLHANSKGDAKDTNLK